MRSWNCFLFATLLCLTAAGCGGKPAVRGGGTPEGVSFSVNPPEAEVLIDNVLKGKAADFRDESPLVVPVGAHLLELHAQGYLPYVGRVAVSSHPKKIEATLRRKEEPQLSKEKNGNGAAPLPGVQP